jgi:hypothetical protein
MEFSIDVRRRGILSIITVVLLGGIVAVFFAIIFIIVQYHLMEYDPMFLMYFIIGLIASLIVFAFSIIVACTNIECLTIFVLVLLFVFDIAIVAIAIFGLAAENRLITWIQALWRPPISESHMLVLVGFEDEFHCCGWTDLRQNCTVNSTQPCERVIPDQFSKYEEFISGTMLGLGLVLFGGLIFAAILTYQRGEDEGEPVLYTDELVPTTKVVPTSKTHSPQQGYDW